MEAEKLHYMLSTGSRDKNNIIIQSRPTGLRTKNNSFSITLYIQEAKKKEFWCLGKGDGVASSKKKRGNTFFVYLCVLPVLSVDSGRPTADPRGHNGAHLHQ